MPITQSHDFWWTRQTKKNQGPSFLGVSRGKGKPLFGRLGRANGRQNRIAGSVKGLLVPDLGVLVWPSRDITVLFPLTEQVSPGIWLPTPAQNMVTHRSLFVWSASRHDGHQQPIGNVALNMRSKVAKISPTNGG